VSTRGGFSPHYVLTRFFRADCWFDTREAISYGF